MSAHQVGSTDEIPVAEGRAHAVDGEQVAVYRLRDGTLRALAAVCPHRGGPLADALIDERVVVCPPHGRLRPVHQRRTHRRRRGSPNLRRHRRRRKQSHRHRPVT